MLGVKEVDRRVRWWAESAEGAEGPGEEGGAWREIYRRAAALLTGGSGGGPSARRRGVLAKTARVADREKGKICWR